MSEPSIDHRVYRTSAPWYPKIPGVSVDKIDVGAGMRMLKQAGYEDPHTVMVINHALLLWRRGEEAQAEKNAIDKSFHGIDFVSWRMVLAAAMAGEVTA